VELADEAGRQTDAVGVQAARLRVDTRKWVASRLLPKKYGDRASLNVGGQADNPPTFADLARRSRGEEAAR